MSPKTVTVTEAVRNFSEYLNRVTYRRESFVLSKGGKAIAELRPLPMGRRLGELPAILDSLPPLTGPEARAFASDIDEARKALEDGEQRDPWASS